MAKISENKLKMLYVLQELMERSDEDHRLGAAELMSAIEAHGLTVDRKTIYDDIETLREAGYDICYIKEQPAGYYIAERDFDLAELKLLVDVVQSARFITDKKTHDLIAKLSSQASVHQGKQLSRQVYIFNRVKALNESIYYNVDRIYSAMLDDKRICFKYHRWNLNKELEPMHGGEPFEVSPWALTWDDENYYLIACDYESKIKFYRVDKMKGIEICKDSRQGEKEWADFDVSKFATRTFNMWGEEPRKVELECNNNMIGPILDRFGTGIILQPEGEDKFRVVVDVCVSNHFYGWIVGLGEGVKIRGPEEVKQAFKEHLSKLL